MPRITQMLHDRLGRLRGGFWLASLFDQGVVSLTTFFTGVLVARTCAQDVYGRYALGMTLVILAIDLQASLITSPLVNLAPRVAPERKASYFGSTLVHQALFALLLALGAAIAAVVFRHEPLAPVLLAIATALPFVTLREYVRRLLMISLRPVTLVLLDAGVTLVHAALLALLFLAGRVAPVTVYLSLAVATAASALSWLFVHRSFFRVDLSAARRDFAANWQTGKWILASGTTWTVISNYIPWCLAAMIGAAATGAWAACFTTAALASPLILGTNNYIGPKVAHSFAGGDPEKLSRETFRCTGVAGGVAALTSTVIALVGPWFLLAMYGEKFTESAAAVWLIACATGMVALGAPTSFALFALGRAGADFAVNLVAFALLLPLAYAGIRWNGVWGAAAALLACNASATALRWAVYLAVRRRPRPEALPGHAA